MLSHVFSFLLFSTMSWERPCLYSQFDCIDEEVKSHTWEGASLALELPHSTLCQVLHIWYPNCFPNLFLYLHSLYLSSWDLHHLSSRLLQLITEMPFPPSWHMYNSSNTSSLVLLMLHLPLILSVCSSQNIICFKFPCLWTCFTIFSNISAWSAPTRSARPSSCIFSTKA